MTTTAIDTTDFTNAQLMRAKANDFVRFIGCLAEQGRHAGAAANVTTADPLDVSMAAKRFVDRWPRSLSVDVMHKAMDWHMKAAVEPGTTLHPSFGSPLSPIDSLRQAFVERSLPNTLIGKIKASAANVPFGTSVSVVTGGGTFRFVGQGAPKPVGNMALSMATLPILKAAGLIILTDELVKLASPAAVATVSRDMVGGMSKYLDDLLTDPTVAAVADVSPASITNGAPSIGSAGTSAANALTDLKKLIADFLATNPNAESMALLMSPAVAVAMAVATNSQTLGANGGTLFGITVHTGAIGSRVVILDPSALLIADDGGLDVTVSRHGTVEMEQTATSPATAGTIAISLWQQNLVGLKIDRFINWKMARANAVLYTNVTYV